MFVYLDASKMQCVIYRPDLYNLQARKSLERYKQYKYNFPLILFRMGFFGAAHGWGAKRPALYKICHTYPTMMKLGTVIPYPKKIQKIYESCDTPLEFC